MAKWISRAMLLALVLACAAGMTASAQIAPTPGPPDAYVRGSGVILVPGPDNSSIRPNMGIFNINVTRVGNQCYGGFTYNEVTPAGVRVVSIMSRRVVSLVLTSANFAVVRAEGVIADAHGSRQCCLTIEALDDNPSGDWFHIRADGCMLPVILYDKAGGVVKGDIAIWQKPAGVAYAKGEGAIEVPSPDAASKNIGAFWFKGELTSAGPVGTISYAEYNPLTNTGIARPRVQIYVPRLSAMKVVGYTATLAGPGMINGKPCFVTVVGVDTAMLDCICPDRFSIEAVDPASFSEKPLYFAAGPLIKGDIVVGTY